MRADPLLRRYVRALVLGELLVGQLAELVAGSSPAPAYVKRDGCAGLLARSRLEWRRRQRFGLSEHACELVELIVAVAGNDVAAVVGRGIVVSSRASIGKPGSHGLH